MPWISKSALDALEETMHTNYWETDPGPDDPPEDDERDVTRTRESLTEAMLKQRLTEALGLLRAIRRQERER